MTVITRTVAITLLLMSTNLFADEASNRAAEKLLDTMGMKEMLDDSIDQMLDMQLQQNPAMMPYKSVMSEFLKKYMNYEMLKPDLTKMYADTFTAAELDEISGFYNTKTGQKAIQSLPTLMAQGGQLGSQKVQEHLPELQSMIQAESERLQNEAAKQSAQ